MIFSHFDKLVSIIERYIDLTNQEDKSLVLDFSCRYKHPWLDELSEISNKDLMVFDGLRDHSIIKSKDWKELITFRDILRSELKEYSPIGSFTEITGNEKKRHEISQIINFSNQKITKDSKVLDIGGGKGHLSFSINSKIGCDCCVVDREEHFLVHGRERADKEGRNVDFLNYEIGSEIPLFIKDIDYMIGLHSCGDFARYSLDFATKSDIPQILHFGCCYSKMKNKEYHLSHKAPKHINFNQRTLSAATLSFNPVDPKFYEFRNQIIDYKFTFYHFLAVKYGNFDFIPMSNSRRSLYKLDIDQFFEMTFKKYLPEFEVPDKEEVKNFFKSEDNQNLLNYLRRYYALQRYIGEFIEIYILMDRAMYLQDQGYQSTLLRLFDPIISPRSICVFAWK